MGAVELVAASSTSPPERTALFNAAYQDYVVPFSLDEARLAFMERAFDVDLDASLVASAGGERVGLANLAVRGRDGWVAGVGVIPSRRGTGLGETLMRRLEEAARARGVERIWLEVIVENVAARRLYEKLGYEHVRELDVWSLPEQVAQSNYRPTPSAAATEPAHARIRELRREREPWQRSDETLARLRELEPPPLGIETDDGAAVLRVAEGRVSVVQLAAAGAAGYEPVLRGAAALGPVSILNLPAAHEAGEALAALGGTVALRQHELVLSL